MLVILGIATALAVQALPPAEQQALERDGQRLQAHLDLARSYAQGTGVALEFKAVSNSDGIVAANSAEKPSAGFKFEPVAALDLTRPASLKLPPELAGVKPWLHPELHVQPPKLLLSPEPLSAPAQIRLTLGGKEVGKDGIAKDGLKDGSASDKSPVFTVTVR